MAWAVGDEEPGLWRLGEPRPQDLFDHIKNGATLVAHNAAFEWVIWNKCCVPKYGWPEIPIEIFRDTMVMAYAMALPASLEKAAAAVGIQNQKDMGGRRVMMQLSQPRRVNDDGSIVWWEDQKKSDILYKYCIQDVKVEHELFSRLMQLSESELNLWHLDHKINQRGIYCDLENVERAIEIVEMEKFRLNEEMKEYTLGEVKTCSEVAKLTAWIADHGVSLEGVAKDDIQELLSTEGLPHVVRRALELRKEAAKSSTAKLIAMRDRVCSDGRIRSTLQFHGAGTGRWAGRGVQVQNLARPNINQDEIEEVFKTLENVET
jgi:DNA polymerase